VSAPLKDTRCLGLIGGLGPAATVYYYRALIVAIERHSRAPRLLIAHADINRVYQYVNGKDYDGLARYLAGLIAQMEAGGAEFTAIVAATPHICAPQLSRRSTLPLIDMMTEVDKALRARQLTRVALLGTRFTIETRMFGRLGDIEVIMPKPDEIDRIHTIYLQVVGGNGTAEHVAELRKLAKTFVTRDGAQAVLVAGTDLSPLLKADNGDVPLIDCADIHIDAIAQRMVG
jgi:aspartate racemase